MHYNSGDPTGRESHRQIHINDEERLFGILSHILTLVIWIFAPLVIYLWKKDESPYIAEQARESLNFQITVAIVGIVLVLSIVGLLLLWVLGILVTILVIVATIKASDNIVYRYPFTLRLLK